MHGRYLPLKSYATFLVLFPLALAATALSGERLEHRPSPPTSDAAPIYLPQARYLRPFSLGYQNILGDILWFRTISYFGEHYHGDRLYPWLAYMCGLVTDLDPQADYVYRFGGMILPWEARQVDAGIAILEKGTRNLPDSWVLHYWLGFSYYFFKNDHDRAAQHLQRAAELPGADPNAATLAARLRREQYGPEMTLAFLNEIARNADSVQVREVAIEQIREINLAIALEQLTTAVGIYRERYGVLPPSPEALVSSKIITEVPVDPFGGFYQIDREDGTVRSSTGHTPQQLYRSSNAEKAQRGESLRE